jgi:hypothetical protein
MSHEEEDTCMSHEEEDTCVSYEQEDTYLEPEVEGEVLFTYGCPIVARQRELRRH